MLRLSWCAQVDADTVKAVANRFILDQDIAIAAMGDTQMLPGARHHPAAPRAHHRRPARAGRAPRRGPAQAGCGRPLHGGGARSDVNACSRPRRTWGGPIPEQRPILSVQLISLCLPSPAADYTWMRRRTYWLRY